MRAIIRTVSYTHLDVYKRQYENHAMPVFYRDVMYREGAEGKDEAYLKLYDGHDWKWYPLLYLSLIHISDISQYCSGKTEPNQEKLFILGNALNVSEAWLMGFDVPMERTPYKADVYKRQGTFYYRLHSY